eukprot:2755592-Pleurochrysis_carterae.AAC.1
MCDRPYRVSRCDRTAKARLGRVAVPCRTATQPSPAPDAAHSRHPLTGPMRGTVGRLAAAEVGTAATEEQRRGWAAFHSLAARGDLAVSNLRRRAPPATGPTRGTV